jgi:CheY-like chemotaxis protein
VWSAVRSSSPAALWTHELEDAGFEVLEAANAFEALVILDNTDIDAVFTDVNTPGSTNGFAHVKLERAVRRARE